MSRLIKILLILGLIQATFMVAGLIVMLATDGGSSGTKAQPNAHVITDVDGDGAADLVLLYDTTRYEGSRDVREVEVTAYSGRTFKPLWTAPLPPNLEDQHSGTLRLELRDGALLQHWYTGVGFLDLKTRAASFAAHEGLLKEPCLGPRGLIAATRDGAAGDMRWPDVATKTLQPTQDTCAGDEEAKRLALKARCAALGKACEGVVLELPTLTPLKAAARAKRGGRQTTLPDRLIWRAGEARVLVEDDALVGQVGESERWRRALGAQDDWTVAGEVVLVADHAQRAVIALDAASGAQRWAFPPRSHSPYSVEGVGEHALVRASRPGARPGRVEHELLVVQLKDGALVEGWDARAEASSWSPSGLAELWRRWRALEQ